MARRQPSPFDRKGPLFKQEPRVLVLCEDTKSSLDYLRDAAHKNRAQADVEVTNCGSSDPLVIVTEAIKLLSKYDFVYCAIDWDQNPRFVPALTLAAQHVGKIEVIASYPCYEYWLMLHFKDTGRAHVQVGDKSACFLNSLSGFPMPSDVQSLGCALQFGIMI